MYSKSQFPSQSSNILKRRPLGIVKTRFMRLTSTQFISLKSYWETLTSSFIIREAKTQSSTRYLIGYLVSYYIKHTQCICMYDANAHLCLFCNSFTGRDITPDFQRLKMKSLIIIFLLATCLFHTSRCVLVTVSHNCFILTNERQDWF